MRKRILIGLLIVGAVWLTACVLSNFALHPIHAEAADQPKCGNVRVTVAYGQTAQLCPGISVFAGTPAASTLPFMPQLATDTPLTFEQCTYTGGWAFSGSSGDIIVTVRETYALQPFSNIDPGFQNPPSESMAVDALAQSLGYHDAGSFGFTLPSDYFTPGIISQLHVYDQAELDWFVPTLVERFANLDGYIDSPGLDAGGCNGSGSWTYSEDDIVQDTGGAVAGAWDWAWHLMDESVWGLCGLFHGC